jgi:hypothetical protein
MPSAQIIPFESGAKSHRLSRDLESWRRRLRLAYERQWDWRAREICKQEIRRLSDLIHDGPSDSAA